MAVETKDLINFKACGNCRHWENNVPHDTEFERYNSVGVCRLSGKLCRFASKCKDWVERKK